MSKIRISTPLPPELTAWLKDIYPAWLQLQQEAFNALVPFNAPQSPLHLNYIEHSAEMATSSIFSNLRIFLTLIGEAKIGLSTDGKMTSDSLELLLQTTDWPNYDSDWIQFHRRPLDQENIGPLDFLIALAIETKLVTVDCGRLRVSNAGHRLSQNLTDDSIVRTVFEAAFSKVNPRTLSKLAHPWVHEQAGIIFWGLSRTADKPRTLFDLTRYCFVPPKKLLSQDLNPLEIYMRAVYLTPLTWFGLMISTAPTTPETKDQDELYFKTPLFDRLMHFDIEPSQVAENAN